MNDESDAGCLMERLEKVKADYHKLQSQLAHHLGCSRVLANCWKILFSDWTNENSIVEALSRMHDASGRGWICITKILPAATGPMTAQTILTIDSSGNIDKGEGSGVSTLSPAIYSEEGFRRLAGGDVFYAAVRELPAPGQDLFKAHGSSSFLAIPIRVHGKWWGIITFEDDNENPIWIDHDIQFMRSFADMVGFWFGQRQVEEDRQASEKRLRLLAENTLDCIWLMNMDLTFTYVNPAVESMFGFTPEEWIGSKLSDHCNPQELQKMKAVIADLLQNHPDQSGVLFETSLQHKNGNEVPIEILGKFVVGEDHQVVGLQGTTREISERKEAERERQRLAAQLRNSQKMEAIGTLAGGIAHDFNNILTAIIGYTELALLDTVEGTRLNANMQEVYRAGNRATALVKQILTISRQTEHERQSIQIEAIVKEALKLMRSSLPTTIEISQQIETGVPPTLADPTHIHQIVMNLCTNAAHAMEKKGGKLTVRLEGVNIDEKFSVLHPDVKPGTYLKLTVSDTGHGIPANILESIFNPYFTTKKVGEGTGLGLSVTQGIVKSYGGEITVESQVGKGATFRVYLPATQLAPAAEAEIAQSLPMGHQRILLVDDEPALAGMGRQRLTRLGYEVEAFTSSKEALSRFKATPERYDMVITDMAMPDLPGDRLARQMLAIRPALPIILCTGYSRRISEEKAKAYGIRSLMMKPISLKDLAETVNQIFNSK
jgi:PAS domain S-box-containing protein